MFLYTFRINECHPVIGFNFDLVFIHISFKSIGKRKVSSNNNFFKHLRSNPEPQTYKGKYPTADYIPNHLLL